VYSRNINGEEYDFGVSGKLIRNVLVMYDRQTDTLWSQLLGEAVQGKLIGTKLEYLPSFQTTWEEWKSLHPDSLALKKGHYGEKDPYSSYYENNQGGVIGPQYIDDRLETKEFVLGVELDKVSVAFPFSQLSLEPVVNYEIGEDNILVVFNAESALGVAYNPVLDGQKLTFAVADGLTIKDNETGSLWDGINGLAIEGELAGKRLERIKSTSSFWFGWKDFHEDTLIFSAN
jgi:hypothetical protein